MRSMVEGPWGGARGGDDAGDPLRPSPCAAPIPLLNRTDMRKSRFLAILALIFFPSTAGAAEPKPPLDPGLQRVARVIREIVRNYPEPVDARALYARGVEAIRRDSAAPEQAFEACMGPLPPPGKAPDAAAVRALEQALRCAGQPASRSEALLDEALAAIASGLDPVSQYYGPAKFAVLMARKDEGRTGLVLEKGADGFHVVTTMAGSPARASGIAGGERLIAVDGAPVADRSFEDVAKMQRGAVSSPVRLTLADLKGAVRQLVLERAARDDSQAVDVELRDGILILSLYELGTNLEYHVRQAIPMEAESIRAILIDLRSNPGGRFDQAWAIPDALLDSGLLVTTRGARKRERRYRARKGVTLPPVPLVVLVNQDTAAGAEVIAAALQDNKRAIVAGRTTRGVGSIQAFIMLAPDRGLRLTTALAIRPDGRALEDAPVVPDCPSTAIGEAALAHALALAGGDRTGCTAPPA